MRRHFDEQIAHLGEEMIAMGALVEHTIEDACEALRLGDVVRARRIMEGDREVDRKEREIEALCLHLLLQQQPVARDLRQISSALKMITDMERIGDQAADISEIVIVMDLTQPRPGHFSVMAHAAVDMVHRAIDAYVRQDVELARQVMESDDVVDELFDQVKGDLAVLLRENAERSGSVLDMLMIAKYFERIGDHAVNIAEWVAYSVTGLYKGEELQ